MQQVPNCFKNLFRLIAIVCSIATIVEANTAFASDTRKVHQTSRKINFSGVDCLLLTGSNFQKGYSYGYWLKDAMEETLDILYDHYVAKLKIEKKTLVAHCKTLFDRYPYSFRKLIEGISAGSGISLDDCIVLNAMETIELINNEHALGHCTFGSIPMDQANAPVLIRNYDYAKPFDLCSKNIVITFVDSQDKIPVAFIGMPGQIFGATCFNEKGIMLSLNNGMPSGGYEVKSDRQSILAKLISILQESETIKDVENQLNAINSDFSLIINAGNSTSIVSAELSTALGNTISSRQVNDAFFSTNFYQNPNWKNLPIVSDESTWMGLIRLSNANTYFNNNTKSITLPKIFEYMNRDISNKGSKWRHTLYQVVYNTYNTELYFRSRHHYRWNVLKMKELFIRLKEINS